MRSSAAVLIAFGVLLLGACRDRDPSESVPIPSNATVVGTAPDLVPAPESIGVSGIHDMGSLSGPAGWQGDLPCADCAGIRTTLYLSPDGTFRLDEGHLGLAPRADTLVGSTGRWTWSPQTQVVSLYGSGESRQFLESAADGALVALDREGAAIVSDLNHTLSPVTHVPTLSGPLRLTGAFSYFADAATLVECRSGLMLPVSMEGPYIELEREYLASGTEPGTPMTVRVTGILESRPAMDGPGTEVVLIVLEYVGLTPEEVCPAIEVRDAIASGRWTLLALDGSAIGNPGAGSEAPTLEWDGEESRIGGSTGCNLYSGRGFLRGTLLVAEPLASTRRFCSGIMETEQRFLEILSDGGAVRLDNGVLILHAGPLEVARFGR